MVVPLIGYVDRFSGRPGECIAVKVSSQFEAPYRADMVRIVHADANPAGPGIKIEEVAAGFAGEYPSRSQPIHSGSLGVVTAGAPIALPDPCTIVVRVQPWLLDGRRQTVFSIEGGLTLLVATAGAVLEAGGGRVQIPAPMLERRWYELRVVASDGRLRFRQTALQRSWGALDCGAAEMPGTAGVLKRLALGAGFTAAPGPHDDPHCAFFNGRIEDPAIILETADEDALIEPERSECLAWWDFSAGIGTDRILDREHALNGSLRNLPTRAVRGSR
jgi:N,N-dimethylformamidase